MLSTLAWAAWIACFAVLEGRALILHRSRDTFSWQVWSAERRFSWLRFAIGAGLLWLAVHFGVIP